MSDTNTNGATYGKVILPRLTGYTAQCALDAQTTNYGDRGYWDSLEISSLRSYVYYAERGDMDTAREMLTRPLFRALQGNEGE